MKIKIFDRKMFKTTFFQKYSLVFFDGAKAAPAPFQLREAGFGLVVESPNNRGPREGTGDPSEAVSTLPDDAGAGTGRPVDGQEGYSLSPRGPPAAPPHQGPALQGARTYRPGLDGWMPVDPSR